MRSFVLHRKRLKSYAIKNPYKRSGQIHLKQPTNDTRHIVRIDKRLLKEIFKRSLSNVALVIIKHVASCQARKNNSPEKNRYLGRLQFFVWIHCGQIQQHREYLNFVQNK